jgi:hypothetical protein
MLTAQVLGAARAFADGTHLALRSPQLAQQGQEALQRPSCARHTVRERRMLQAEEASAAEIGARLLTMCGAGVCHRHIARSHVTSAVALAW